jgi:hypothetical protein
MLEISGATIQNLFAWASLGQNLYTAVSSYRTCNTPTIRSEGYRLMLYGEKIAVCTQIKYVGKADFLVLKRAVHTVTNKGANISQRPKGTSKF